MSTAVDVKSKPDMSASSDDESNFEDVKLTCDVCKAIFSGTKPYEQHLKGSTHKKAVMKKKYKKKNELAKLALLDDNASNGALTNGKEDANSDDDSDSGTVYTCVACKVICSGHTSYELHLGGRQHRKQCRKQKLMDEIEQDSSMAASKSKVPDDALYDIAPQIKPYASCSVCSKSFSGPESFKKHMESSSHQKTSRFQQLMKEMEDDNAEFKKMSDSDASGDEDSKGLPFCSDCNKIFSGPLPYKQHMLSDAHKKQVKNLKSLSKVKDLVFAVEGESGLQCTECGRSFSGPKPFKDHLKGQGHKKSMKQSKLLDHLKDKYPDVVEQSSKDISVSDEDSNDQESVLACNICHKAFSGPENAEQHLTSKKHLNAVREKHKLDKIRKLKEAKKQRGSGKIQSDQNTSATKDSSSKNTRTEDLKNLSKKNVPNGRQVKPTESQNNEEDSEDEFEKIVFPKH